MSQPSEFDDEWSSPSEWARMYRRYGLQVVPAYTPREGGSNWKRPRLEKWGEFEDTLIPDSLFERWYGAEGDHRARSNMGLITGLASGGAFCVDLDTHKEGSQARQWWADLLAENAHGQEPLTPAQRTGGGGRQLVFRAPEGWSAPTFKTPIGIDIRGQGGFMMAPPSMHESGKSYAWEAGKGPWQCAIADAPDWLIDAIEHLKEEHARNAGSTARRERTESDGSKFDPFGFEIDDREQRMMVMVWAAALDLRRRFPDAAEPFPGDAASELDRIWEEYLRHVKPRLQRPGLTKEALLDLEGRGRQEMTRKWRRALSLWNGKLAQEAGKPNPHAKAAEPPPKFTEQPDGSFVDNETGEIHEPDPPGQKAASPDDFPLHLTRVPGLVGDIVDWMEATARYPQRALALCAALPLVGTIAGRKYATPTRSGTHLYTLALAPTGAGKNHAPKLSKRLLKKAGLDLLNGPSRYMSMSAVFAELGKKPRHLAFIDEFGAEVARIASGQGSPHERAVKDILRTAWGCSFEDLRPLSYADGRAIEPIVSPSLSISGMSTPEEFYRSLQGDDVFNGFLNRFLIIRVSTRPFEVEPAADEFEVPGPILWAISKIKDRISGQITAATAEDGQPVLRLDWASQAARDAYGSLRHLIQRREEDEALLSRTAEMACRLATIRAIGKDPEDPRPTVSVDDMDWGMELALWSAERMIHDAANYMSESEHQARVLQVLRVVKAGGKTPIRRAELVLRLKHQFNARTLNEVLESLIESEQVGVIEGQTTSAGGRKPVSYVAL